MEQGALHGREFVRGARRRQAQAFVAGQGRALPHRVPRTLVQVRARDCDGLGGILCGWAYQAGVGQGSNHWSVLRRDAPRRRPLQDSSNFRRHRVVRSSGGHCASTHGKSVPRDSQGAWLLPSAVGPAVS